MYPIRTSMLGVRPILLVVIYYWYIYTRLTLIDLTVYVAICTNIAIDLNSNSEEVTLIK